MLTWPQIQTKKDDPIDQAINNAYGARDTSDKAAIERLYTIGFNPIVKRVVACVNSNGKTFTIAKGLPAKILDTSSGGTDDHELQWNIEGSRDDFAMVSRVDLSAPRDTRPWLLLCVRATLENQTILNGNWWDCCLYWIRHVQIRQQLSTHYITQIFLSK